MAAEDAVIRTVPVRVVRAAAIAVCAVGIIGMIATSIADNAGAAITFGLVAAAAALCLIVVAAIQPPARAAARGLDEQRAAALEERIAQLVQDGADEDVVRELVREAIRLGRDAER